MEKNDLNEKGGMRIADTPAYHKHAELNQENQFSAYFKQKKNSIALCEHDEAERQKQSI